MNKSCSNCRYGKGWHCYCSLHNYHRCRTSCAFIKPPRNLVSFWRPQGRYLRGTDTLRPMDLLYDGCKDKWVTVKYLGYVGMEYETLNVAYPLAVRRPS